MPEKHLFVNSSHYQDRPDATMRQMIASHAAKYGPNGSLAFKTSPESTIATNDRDITVSTRYASPDSTHSKASSPTLRSTSASPNSPPNDVRLIHDYDSISARLANFCICADECRSSTPESKGKAIHDEKCTLLGDYLTLMREHELPFRVPAHIQQAIAETSSSSVAEGLVLQCLLVVGQANIDGMNPKFKGKATNRTLTLQQRALSAMQRTISKQSDAVDDSLVLASAVMLSTAAYYADHDAYKAHLNSLQKLIELQGGLKQLRAPGLVKTLMASGEISLAHHRYIAIKKKGVLSESGPAEQWAPPLKVKFPMPPIASEVVNIIESMSLGFQSLAKASKLSIQALQLLHLACRWSELIDQPLKSEAEDKQLLAGTAAANTRLFHLYDSALQTKRMASLLLISLPVESKHLRFEKCLCLGFVNLLHSVTLQPHPIPLRDRLVGDFAEAVFTLHPKDDEEEDCMIWLALAVASEWRHCAAKMQESPLPAQHGYDGVLLSQIWLQRSRQLMDWVLAKCERSRTWEELAAICSRFLWLQRMGTEWKHTWKEAMERRTRNMPRKKSRS